MGRGEDLQTGCSIIDSSLSHQSLSFGLFMRVRLRGERKRCTALTQAHKTSLHVQSSEAVEKCKHPRRHPNCSLCNRYMPLKRERAAGDSSKVFQGSCFVRGSLSGGMHMISHRLSRCLSWWQESEEDSRGVLPVFERRGRPGN